MQPHHNSKLSVPNADNSQFPLISLTPSPPSSNQDSESLDLNWLFAVLRRRAILILGVVAATTLTSGLLIFLRESSATPQYTGNFQLLVEPVTAEEQLARQSATAQGGALSPANIQLPSLDYETQIRILRSPKLVEPVVEKLQKQFYPEVPTEILQQAFLSQLLIERINYIQDGKELGTKLIQISYQDQSPELVQFVLKELSNTYLQYSLEERKTSIDQAIGFIDEQLPVLQDRVDELQTQLQQFREENILIDPALEGSQLSQQSGVLEQQQLETQTQLAEARSQYAALRRQFARNDSISVLSTTPEYNSLLTQLQEVEGQLALEQARVSEINPSLQALRDKQQNLRRLLAQEAQRVLSRTADQINVLEDRRQSIAQSEGTLEQQIQALPNAARQYADLQQRLEIATNILNEFSARQKALQIDAAQQDVPWELINPPTLQRDDFGEPVNVAAISKSRYLALAMVLSLLLGIGVGFLVEILTDTYHTAEEIQRETKLPVLGTIPLLKDEEVQRTSAFFETFRSLFTKVSLLNPDKLLRSLVVSSASPAEGKSIVALNLAIAAATLGQRVLLVDADLRQSRLRDYIKLPSAKGLTNILVGGDNFMDVVQQSPDIPNLFVLTAGETSPDPIKLMASQPMHDLIKRFEQSFDLVIYDTPPLTGLADASLIAARTDKVLFVARLGKTKRADLTQAIESLKVSNLPILGVVANGAEHYSPVPYRYTKNQAIVSHETN